MKVLVSACLLGVRCRYDGKSAPNDSVLALLDKHELIPVCPEQLGGLSTPRLPAERVGDLVLTIANTDVTQGYTRGALETLRIARLFGCDCAVLKERSPSCGCGAIYDGTFSRTLTNGDGLTTAQLRDSGMTVYGESQVGLLLHHDNK